MQRHLGETLRRPHTSWVASAELCPGAGGIVPEFSQQFVFCFPLSPNLQRFALCPRDFSCPCSVLALWQSLGGALSEGRGRRGHGWVWVAERARKSWSRVRGPSSQRALWTSSSVGRGAAPGLQVQPEPGLWRTLGLTRSCPPGLHEDPRCPGSAC